MNDRVARRIDALLGSLNRQLHLEETGGLKHAILLTGHICYYVYC
jgi:hypothetical protein